MKKFLLSLCSFFIAFALFADSPLTSTRFWEAYANVPQVKKASECNGVLTPDLMKFLNSKASIDKKVALINAVGWNFNGLNNFDAYKKYLKKGLGKGRIKAENMLCLSYLKAMDNYFDCNIALKLATEALSLNPDSYTFNIIHGLINAQVSFDYSMCATWKSVDNVRNNQNLNMDLNPEAIKIIFEYMDLYKSSCDEEEEYYED